MKKIILLGVPHHNNLGDSAITEAEKQFIKDNFEDYKYHQISEETLEKCLPKIQKCINDEDIIFLHGGGNFGDEYLYIEEGRRKAIQTFPNNVIILFPQTIYFNNTETGQEELKKSKEIYAKHKKLILIAREHISYEIMKKEFHNNVVIQTPDIVTYLNETEPKQQRKGALLLLRGDIEAKLTEIQKQSINEIVKKYFVDIEYTDTAIGEGIKESQRKQKLENMFNKYRKAQLVITDRLHGMIFSAITSTPCIALGNYNHKIEATGEYLKKLGYIKFINDISKLENEIKDLLNIQYKDYDNTFALNEFKKIKEVLDEYGEEDKINE